MEAKKQIAFSFARVAACHCATGTCLNIRDAKGHSLETCAILWSPDTGRIPYNSLTIDNGTCSNTLADRIQTCSRSPLQTSYVDWCPPTWSICHFWMVNIPYTSLYNIVHDVSRENIPSCQDFHHAILPLENFCAETGGGFIVTMWVYDQL